MQCERSYAGFFPDNTHVANPEETGAAQHVSACLFVHCFEVFGRLLASLYPTHWYKIYPAGRCCELMRGNSQENKQTMMTTKPRHTPPTNIRKTKQKQTDNKITKIKTTKTKQKNTTTTERRNLNLLTVSRNIHFYIR